MPFAYDDFKSTQRVSWIYAKLSAGVYRQSVTPMVDCNSILPVAQAQAPMVILSSFLCCTWHQHGQQILLLHLFFNLIGIFYHWRSLWLRQLHKLKGSHKCNQEHQRTQRTPGMNHNCASHWDLSLLPAAKASCCLAPHQLFIPFSVLCWKK